MTNSPLTVAQNLAVSLDYTLRLNDGEVVDSSADREPLTFLQGHGQVIPGLEKALVGMMVGEEKEIVVAPADGYGEIQPDSLQLVPRNTFPSDMALEPGLGLHMRDSDTGEVFQVFVAEVRPNGVLLDFNHPLAGETLYFNIKVTELRLATPEELAHGHVHGSGHEHNH